MLKPSPAPGIAWRYLVSKKSHSAVGAISTVSMCGMAVATAAIICVLSVFNGFRDVIGMRLDSLSPDIMVTPAKGKVFENADSIAAQLAGVDGVALATPTLTDNALAICDAREMPVTVKGVDPAAYARVTALDSLIIATADNSDTATVSPATFSIGAAAGLSAMPGNNVLLFTPRREGRVNLANPAASFLTDSVAVTRVFRSDQSQFDENFVIINLDMARDLLQYDSEASAVELRAAPGFDTQRLTDKISNLLGPDFIVKDRLHQQEMSFRMISIEKWVTSLLLFFILLIASFNIISSLSMLVIEKEKSIGTLRALGFSRRGIGSIFFYESLYVTAAGGLTGIILGVALTLVQQYFGLIKLQGDPATMIITAYPVHLNPLDILITLVPISLIGIATAFITAAFARQRAAQESSQTQKLAKLS